MKEFKRFLQFHRTIISMLCIVALVVAFSYTLYLADKAISDREGKIEENKSQIVNETVDTEKYIEKLYESAEDLIIKKIPGIVCWGDSLTAGMGAQKVNYPMELEALISQNITETFNLSSKIKEDYKYLVNKFDHTLSVPVVNMGAVGDTTNATLGRAGVVPFVLAEDITIPVGRSNVEIKLQSENGSEVAPMRYTDLGMESVTISGIKGKIEISQASQTSVHYKYYFKRDVEGNSQDVPAGTIVKTSGSEAYNDHIPIIFIGATGGWETSYELVMENRGMVSGHNKYIIIGLPTGTASSRKNLEDAMVKEFGDNYINLREYLCTDGLTDAGLTPTAEDLACMAEGTVPISLRAEADNGHLNDIGYTLLANLVYERMDDLGYFDELRLELENLK